MKLSAIMQNMAVSMAPGVSDPDISSIAYDSRKACVGSLFVAVAGEKADGHDYIADAVKKGAIAVIHERPAHEVMKLVEKAELHMPVLIRADDSRKALACASANFFGRPSESVFVVGVTGTNGKTTTTHILKSIFEAWGKKAGLIGTIGNMIGQELTPATHTTPESLEFQELLARMRDSGCTHVAAEVSSHALDQKRTDCTLFSGGIFTNLTQDHLDYHETMERYMTAKERLFFELLDEEGFASINFDDPSGRRLAAELKENAPNPESICSYGLGAGADLMASDVKSGADGLVFTVFAGAFQHEIRSSLIGLFNVHNILAACGLAWRMGIPWDRIIEGVASAGDVRGRFERVDAGQDFLAIVDFAHTEDALERLLHAARGLSAGKIITVFGCGGDRDRTKRPRMGAAASKLSDLVIITSDNPRSEDPMEIIRQIESGIEKKNYMVEPDRMEAVRKAVAAAAKDDMVIVAGKGHENYQEIAGKRYEYGDGEALIRAIRELVSR